MSPKVVLVTTAFCAELHQSISTVSDFVISDWFSIFLMIKKNAISSFWANGAFLQPLSLSCPVTLMYPHVCFVLTSWCNSTLVYMGPLLWASGTRILVAVIAQSSCGGSESEMREGIQELRLVGNIGCFAGNGVFSKFDSVEFDSLVHMIKYLSIGYIITEKIMPYYPLSQRRKRMSVLKITAEIPVLFLAISNHSWSHLGSGLSVSHMVQMWVKCASHLLFSVVLDLVTLHFFYEFKVGALPLQPEATVEELSRWFGFTRGFFWHTLLRMWTELWSPHL